MRVPIDLFDLRGCPGPPGQKGSIVPGTYSTLFRLICVGQDIVQNPPAFQDEGGVGGKLDPGADLGLVLEFFSCQIDPQGKDMCSYLSEFRRAFQDCHTVSRLLQC